MSKDRMMGDNKDFDPVSYKISDPKAKKLAIEYFYNQWDIKLIENTKNKYDIDLLGVHKSINFYMEVEHREQYWTKGRFPFSDVHIFERRGKYLHRKNSIYVVFSVDWSTIGILLPDDVEKYIQPKYMERIYNEFNKKEYAYCIPREDFYWISLPQKNKNAKQEVRILF